MIECDICGKEFERINKRICPNCDGCMFPELEEEDDNLHSSRPAKLRGLSETYAEEVGEEST